METRTILITGASSGIGKDAAIRLAELGHTVYTAARRIEKMKDLREIGCHPLKVDITNEDEVDSAFQTIQENHGGIDILVNNAGYGLYGAMEDIPIEDARYQFDVNLFGLAHLTQLVLPHMREQGFGRIINMSSMGGKVYTPLGSWYHATKHALEGWTDCLRLEVEPFGIHVSLIEPGAIDTEFGDVMTDPILKYSGETAYGDFTKNYVEVVEKNYRPGSGSPPSVITDLIVKAIEAKRPRTRYVAGKYARPMMFIRKWLGDRIYDRIVMAMLR